MSLQLIKIESAPDLVDQVYNSLLDAISDGSMAPGERIMQEDIAEQLAVSRQPVLQALRMLKKDGFVLDAPGRGVLVAPLDVGWLVQIYQVRSALDALAARLAARALSNRPGADQPGTRRRPRQQCQGHDGHRLAVSCGPLCCIRQSADRPERPVALAPHPPRHGCGVAGVDHARIHLG